LIAEELNVKCVEFTSEADHYVHYQVKPNFKALGPKFGKLAPRIAKVLQSLPDAAAARKSLAADGQLTIDLDQQSIALTADEVEIRLDAKEGWSAAQGRVGVVVLSTELTDDLRQEGMIRELIHHVQSLRKEQNLAYQARITVHVGADEGFEAIVRQFETELKEEVLAKSVEFTMPTGTSPVELRIEGHEVHVAVSPAQ
jgi:isoleucyl-tRNA synthetase